MKIIYNKYFPRGNFWAINIFGIVIAQLKHGKLPPEDINHERIHSSQIWELLGIIFYIAYVVEWGIRIIQYKNITKAYYNISFEREAYKHMYNMEYLKQRKRFAFIHYFKKHK